MLKPLLEETIYCSHIIGTTRDLYTALLALDDSYTFQVRRNPRMMLPAWIEHGALVSTVYEGKRIWKREVQITPYRTGDTAYLVAPVWSLSDEEKKECIEPPLRGKQGQVLFEVTHACFLRARGYSRPKTIHNVVLELEERYLQMVESGEAEVLELFD
jgi:hypothetical protein